MNNKQSEYQSFRLQIIFKRRQKFSLHVLDQEMLEFRKVNLPRVIFIQRVKELINITPSRLLLNSLLFEMILKQVHNLVSIKHAIAVSVIRLESLLHDLHLLLAERRVVLVDRLHLLVLLDDVTDIVLVPLRIHLNL